MDNNDLIQLKKNAGDRLYLILIGIASLIMLVFLPMVGSTIGLDWSLPDTVVGWIVWATTKTIMAGLNMLIFYCFMEQAKLNIKDDPDYKEAKTKIQNTKVKNFKPRSPKKFNRETYGQKGVAIFFGTLASTIALTQALLTFDIITFVSYLFTLVMGVVFGLLQMKKSEDYWTNEFVQYVNETCEGGNTHDHN